MTVGEALERLQKSRFRSGFHLSAREKAYVQEKGYSVIQQHARDFIGARLAPAVILNDGKQTPMKGHPVFLAQHACACCCRGCFEKWYGIPPGVELTSEQQEGIVRLLMTWIRREMNS